MSASVAGAYIHWQLNAVEHDRYYGLGMDAHVTGCSHTLSLVWLGHGCHANRMLSNMDGIMARAWMLLSLDALAWARSFKIDDPLTAMFPLLGKN